MLEWRRRHHVDLVTAEGLSPNEDDKNEQGTGQYDLAFGHSSLLFSDHRRLRTTGRACPTPRLEMMMSQPPRLPRFIRESLRI